MPIHPSKKKAMGDDTSRKAKAALCSEMETALAPEGKVKTRAVANESSIDSSGKLTKLDYEKA